MPDQRTIENKHIVLGITSGIAAYKAPMIVRGLTGLGAQVQVVMSANAHRFVSPMALQAVAGLPIRQDLWDEEAEAAMGHIELARWADCVLIAPATCNTIAKLAQGGADDLLSTICLATQAPIVIAPAMNQAMYAHATTQRNLATLAEMGYASIGPDSGEQACGDVGAGRMSEPEEIVGRVVDIVHQQAAIPDNTSALAAGPLTGKRVMITTGPTLEAIDPVRYISNHSSGLQGLSIAEAALHSGAAVTLIAGPNVAASHPDIERIDVTSALEMQAAVQKHLAGLDIFIGVAAVADYRPADPAEQNLNAVANRVRE